MPTGINGLCCLKSLLKNEKCLIPLLDIYFVCIFTRLVSIKNLNYSAPMVQRCARCVPDSCISPTRTADRYPSSVIATKMPSCGQVHFVTSHRHAYRTDRYIYIYIPVLEAIYFLGRQIELLDFIHLYNIYVNICYINI